MDCFKEMSGRQGGMFVTNASNYHYAYILCVGALIQQPPSATVAAQVVANILQSASPSHSADSVSEKEEEHDSTDTEDSDDSEKEQVSNLSLVKKIVDETVCKVTEISSSTNNVSFNDQTSILENIETHPTPPPRKKKLKKKLEQMIEKQCEQTLSEETSTPSNETSDVIIPESSEHDTKELCGSNTVLSEKLSVENDKCDPLPASDEGKSSPKKSRRKKKHVP